MCGKDHSIFCRETFHPGSPPRVRERHPQKIKDVFAQRITPACAGKTIVSVVGAFCSSDHPRVCGKDKPFAKFFRYLGGSPPRVRERLYPSSRLSHLTRITPACAGKTSQTLALSQTNADHPRVCGKDFYLLSEVYLPHGSPPRVRERQ